MSLLEKDRTNNNKTLQESKECQQLVSLRTEFKLFFPVTGSFVGQNDHIGLTIVIDKISISRYELIHIFVKIY